MQPGFDIQSFEVQSFAVNSKILIGKNISYEYKLEFKPSIRIKKKVFEILLVVSLESKANPHQKICTIETNSSFKFADFYQITENLKEVDMQLQAQLLGVAISTTRGILHQKLSDSKLRTFLIPVHSPLQIIKDSSNDNQFILSQINILFSLRNYEKALDLSNKILEREPKDLAFLYNQGIILLALSRFKEALSYFNKYIKLDKSRAAAFSNRGFIRGKLGRRSEALSDHKKALGLDPLDPNTYINLSDYYTQKNNFKTALEYLFKYNSLVQNNPLILNAIADTYRKQRHLDEAYKFAEDAIKVDPDFELAYGTMAEIFADKKDEEKFYEYLESALIRGFNLKLFIDDSVYSSYKNSPRFKKLLKKHHVLLDR